VILWTFLENQEWNMLWACSSMGIQVTISFIFVMWVICKRKIFEGHYVEELRSSTKEILIRSNGWVLGCLRYDSYGHDKSKQCIKQSFVNEAKDESPSVKKTKGIRPCLCIYQNFKIYYWYLFILNSSKNGISQ
jgi:hypothetical protein